MMDEIREEERVTILILIDGFLKYKVKLNPVIIDKSHNPYFNRWFSAIYSDYWNNKDCSEWSQSLF